MDNNNDDLSLMGSMEQVWIYPINITNITILLLVLC